MGDRAGIASATRLARAAAPRRRGLERRVVHTDVHRAIDSGQRPAAVATVGIPGRREGVGQDAASVRSVAVGSPALRVRRVGRIERGVGQIPSASAGGPPCRPSGFRIHGGCGSIVAGFLSGRRHRSASNDNGKARPPAATTPIAPSPFEKNHIGLLAGHFHPQASGRPAGAVARGRMVPDLPSARKGALRPTLGRPRHRVQRTCLWGGAACGSVPFRTRRHYSTMRWRNVGQASHGSPRT